IKTIKRKMASIKAWFNFLEFEDEITISPFRKLKLSLKEPQQLPTLMNQEEVKKILYEAYQDFSRHIPDTNSATRVLRDMAVLELLFATGMRVSELCNLQFKDFDLDSGSILVLGKGRKQRLIQVCNESVLRLMRLYRSKVETDSAVPERFFINRLGKPLSDQSVRFMIKKYYLRAGITKHITPHSFRHTFATLLLEEDVDIRYIQHLLGHSSIAVTQIYTHVNQEKQRQILSDKHPRSKFELGIE
ncbi:MAG: tyrosine-type recombinase/integrase, partial [Bacteroidota bacterium]